MSSVNELLEFKKFCKILTQKRVGRILENTLELILELKPNLMILL